MSDLPPSPNPLMSRRLALKSGAVGVAAWSVPVAATVLLTPTSAQATSPVPGGNRPEKPRPVTPDNRATPEDRVAPDTHVTPEDHLVPENHVVREAPAAPQGRQPVTSVAHPQAQPRTQAQPNLQPQAAPPPVVQSAASPAAQAGASPAAQAAAAPAAQAGAPLAARELAQTGPSVSTPVITGLALVATGAAALAVSRRTAADDAGAHPTEG